MSLLPYGLPVTLMQGLVYVLWIYCLALQVCHYCHVVCQLPSCRDGFRYSGFRYSGFRYSGFRYSGFIALHCRYVIIAIWPASYPCPMACYRYSGFNTGTLMQVWLYCLALQVYPCFHVACQLPSCRNCYRYPVLLLSSYMVWFSYPGLIALYCRYVLVAIWPVSYSHAGLALNRYSGFIALHCRYVLVAILPASYSHVGVGSSTQVVLPCIAGMSFLPCCLPVTLIQGLVQLPWLYCLVLQVCPCCHMACQLLSGRACFREAVLLPCIAGMSLLPYGLPATFM